MRILGLDLHAIRVLNAATGGALYRHATAELAHEREPELLVVRVPPDGTMPVRWYLEALEGLVEIHAAEALVVAVHVHLRDESARLRHELEERFARSEEQPS